MKKKSKEMGCKAGQCGSEMKKDEKPAAEKPADTSATPTAAPADSK
jgi:hypothetical protein